MEVSLMCLYSYKAIGKQGRERYCSKMIWWWEENETAGARWSHGLQGKSNHVHTNTLTSWLAGKQIQFIR